MSRGKRGALGRTAFGGPRRGYAQVGVWIYRDCPACHARRGYPCGRWDQARQRYPRYDEPTWLTRKRPCRGR